MINLIIGIIVVVAASYLIYQTLHNETRQKTKILVSITFLIGLVNIIGDLAI